MWFRLDPARREGPPASAQESFEVEPPLFLVFATPIRQPAVGGLDGGVFGIEPVEEFSGLGELRELAEHVRERDLQALRIGRGTERDAEFVSGPNQLVLLSE